MGDIFSDRLWTEWPRMMGEEWHPDLELKEKDGKYFLRAELPGMEKDMVKVVIDGDLLTISGEKKQEKEEEGETFYLKETSYGSFSRSLRLPAEIDAKAVKAKLKNGVLNLELPQKTEEKAKKIEIS
jgi:HSP20 family protein